MSGPPSMPLFVDDYEAATAHLTLEEDGAYNRLLRLCWRMPDCDLPDDPAWIARRLRVNKDTFERVVAPLIDEFFSRSDGRIFQKRLRKENRYVKSIISKRKSAGRKGGAAKALKKNEKTPDTTSDLPEQTESKPQAPNPYPKPIPSNKQKHTKRARDFEADFTMFWNVVRHKVGKDAAYTSFAKRRREGVSTETLVEGFMRYVETKPPDRQWCNPATWLNQGRWDDQPADVEADGATLDFDKIMENIE